MVKSNVKTPENYESALKELEVLLVALEGGKLPLEKSIEAYGRGAELLHYCQAQLADAQQRIQVLEGEKLQDFSGNDQPD